MNMQTDTVSADLEAAVDVMRRGGVIIYPTDTVWGIGCDATMPAAVARVYAIKRRSDSKALITLVDSMEMLRRFVDDVPKAAVDMIDETERPLTVVYDHARNLAPNLMAPDGSVGVRITRHDFSAALCRLLGNPVVSTSVNRSGCPAARTFAEIPADIMAEVDYTVMFGRRDESVSPPSRVVKISSDGKIVILRP